MKLHEGGTANRRISKGGFAVLNSLKIDRIHPFDIHYSIFDIRFFRASASIKLAALRASGRADT
jgi:hypothetical protein